MWAPGDPGRQSGASTHGNPGDRPPIMLLVTPFCFLTPGDPCLDAQHVAGLAESPYWKWQLALLGPCLLAHRWQLLSKTDSLWVSPAFAWQTGSFSLQDFSSISVSVTRSGRGTAECWWLNPGPQTCKTSSVPQNYSLAAHLILSLKSCFLFFSLF